MYWSIIKIKSVADAPKSLTVYLVCDGNEIVAAFDDPEAAIAYKKKMEDGDDDGDPPPPPFQDKP